VYGVSNVNIIDVSNVDRMWKIPNTGLHRSHMPNDEMNKLF